VVSVNGQTGVIVLSAANVGAVPTGRTVATQHSLTGGGDLSGNRTLSLVNDNAAPGMNRLYSTNGTGVRGWWPAPKGIIWGHCLIYGHTSAGSDAGPPGGTQITFVSPSYPSSGDLVASTVYCSTYPMTIQWCREDVADIEAGYIAAWEFDGTPLSAETIAANFADWFYATYIAGIFADNSGGVANLGGGLVEISTSAPGSVSAIGLVCAGSGPFSGGTFNIVNYGSDATGPSGGELSAAIPQIGNSQQVRILNIQAYSPSGSYGSAATVNDVTGVIAMIPVVPEAEQGLMRDVHPGSAAGSDRWLTATGQISVQFDNTDVVGGDLRVIVTALET
jgi:hypothetical protein